MPTDEDGYTGRECPNQDCKGYFKIVFGTGLPGTTLCHCPYCGHEAEHSEFHTPDQVSYIASMAMRGSSDALAKEFRRMEFEHKPKGPFGIGFSLKYSPGPPHPIHYYREKSLETHVECANCTLKYAVYGVFAFCPDCAQHDAVQILDENLRMIGKMLDMAQSADQDVADHLLTNSLVDCVSAFDGFGREICRVHRSAAADQTKVDAISFQNLAGVNRNLNSLFGIDLSTGVIPDEWTAAICAFQKRHLISHKMGVIDDDYIQRSGDKKAVVGRKVATTPDEVRGLSKIISKLSRHLADALRNAGTTP